MSWRCLPGGSRRLGNAGRRGVVGAWMVLHKGGARRRRRVRSRSRWWLARMYRWLRYVGSCYGETRADIFCLAHPTHSNNSGRPSPLASFLRSGTRSHPAPARDAATTLGLADGTARRQGDDRSVCQARTESGEAGAAWEKGQGCGGYGGRRGSGV